jgi:hypothetical protein
MSWSRAKKCFPLAASILLSALALITCVVGQSRPKTVTDFYLKLPTSFNVKNLDETPFRDGFFFDEFFENEATTSKEAILKHRRSLIEIEDLANGYLKLEPKGSDGWEQIALFKKVDGAYLIALSQVECGPGCSGDLMFLAYSKGTWTNVTKQVFPADPFSDKGYFKLPRVGTTIELICSDESNEGCKDESILTAFKWNKDKFVKNFSNFGEAQSESFWPGKYEQEDGGGKEIEQLVVRQTGDKLVAVYRSVVTAQLWQFYSLTVEIKGNTALFYYDRCLPKEGDKDYDGSYDPYPCSKDTNKKGDLMFKFVKSVAKNKKIIILTYDMRNDSLSKGKVRFKRA